MGHVAFRIPDFWPHDPSTWFRKNQEQIPNLQHQTILNKIRSPALRPAQRHLQQHQNSLAEIDENAADAYEQLKALLMSRYTMDRWARAFELHKFPEIGDM